MGWLSTLKVEWRVIADAPWSFAAVVLATGTVLWFILKGLKAQEVENLKARLQLRDDEIADYKRKLNGATPDEAKARLDELERLAALQRPRQITEQQREVIFAGITPFRDVIQIDCVVGVPDARTYAAQLVSVFQAAGWSVRSTNVLTPWQGPPNGLVAFRRSADDRQPIIEGTLQALRSAGIAIAVHSSPKAVPDGANLRILVGPRTA